MTPQKRKETAEKIERAIGALYPSVHESPDEKLSNLIADIQHFAKANEIDFDNCLIQGTAHFEAETATEDEFDL